MVHGITKFSDLTKPEFENKHMGLKLASDTNGNGLPDDVDELLKNGKASKWSGVHDELKSKFLGMTKNTGSKDWAAEGVTSPIKDQGHCGSCWAHSVVETLESDLMQRGINFRSYAHTTRST